MIIGITGTNGAGKGVVVDYLVHKKGFTHYSSRKYLTEELERRNIEISRPNLRGIGNEFRQKFGAGYLVEHFLEEAKKHNIENLVIESLRSSGEAKKLKDAGGLLLVVDADRKIRYDRISARKSATDLLDFDTFVEQEEQEWYGAEGKHDMNIRSVIEMADHTIFNNISLHDLHQQIDAFLQKFE
jgi:dephospho-CoA kinase